MKPGKILFLLTIILTITLINPNIVKAEKSSCNLGKNGGTCTFYKGEYDLDDLVSKFKVPCNKETKTGTKYNDDAVAGSGGNATCIIYFKEKFYVQTKKGPIETKQVQFRSNASNVAREGDNYYKAGKNNSDKTVVYVSEKYWAPLIPSGGKTTTNLHKFTKARFKKMTVKIDGKVRVGKISRLLSDCKSKNSKGAIKEICDTGAKVDDLDVAKQTNEDRKHSDKDKEPDDKVSEVEAKKILKSEIKSTNCKELLGDDLVEILQSLVDIVKVAVPILLIALGTLDFGKAIFSSDDNEMKKAQSKFMKRLLAAAAIFLVPSLLGVLLNLGHSIWGDVIKTDLCGIKF